MCGFRKTGQAAPPAAQVGRVGKSGYRDASLYRHVDSAYPLAGDCSCNPQSPRWRGFSFICARDPCPRPRFFGLFPLAREPRKRTNVPRLSAFLSRQFLPCLSCSIVLLAHSAGFIEVVSENPERNGRGQNSRGRVSEIPWTRPNRCGGQHLRAPRAKGFGRASKRHSTP